MSKTVIKIENLSKQYRLGTVGTGTLAHDLNRWWAGIRGKEDPTLKIGQENVLSKKLSANSKQSDYVWALKDINLEVKEGEILGIIGKNGAGKSTLLKLLSRVTAPTTGSIKVKGRIASLLEVGTGFHPELTGRENIFLNGAILGMTKQEIRSKFDEIIDFAGIGKYVDTPVKRYSSGMHVRLGFAVAAHLDPEILVVDEVLAVGDAEFQKKALGKMKNVSEGQGRTILFVSHNMRAIKSICESTLVIRNGQESYRGSTNTAIQNYLNDERDFSFSKINTLNIKNRKGDQSVIWEKVEISDSNNNNSRCFSIGEAISFKFKVNNTIHEKAAIGVQIKSSDGVQLCNIINSDSNFPINNLFTETHFKFEIEDIRLYPDTYWVSFWIGSVNSSETYDYLEDIISFEIINGGSLTSRHLPRSAGLIYFTPKWEKVNC